MFMEGRDNSSKSEGTNSVLLAMLLKLQSPDNSLSQNKTKKPYDYLKEKKNSGPYAKKCKIGK